MARLWWRGSWPALGYAVGFAVLLNLLVLTSFLWTELLPAGVQVLGWLVAFAWWTTAGLFALRTLPELMSTPTAHAHEGLFVQAQSEYLKGNWFEAEAQLRKLLRHEPGDAEALLLLASVHRRTDRIDEARQQLQRLARLESAAKWQLEIQHERAYLRRLAEHRRASEEAAPLEGEVETALPPSPVEEVLPPDAKAA